tara:strand:- start:607 stop:1143 length:537 start_codon:yes stop_codon:yes gene_type:complete
MSSDCYKRKPIIKISNHINILDGTWNILKTENNLMYIYKYQSYSKRVRFSENIEINRIENNKIVKSTDKMIYYGEPPDKLNQLFEHYLFNIINTGDIHLSRFNFMNSLRVLKIYHFFMSEFIHTHYVLSKIGKKMLYSKRTLIKSPHLIILTKFLTSKTDLIRRLNIISKFFRKYCVK